MAKFKGSVKQCVICDASFKVPACRAEKAICCSRKCKDLWWSAQRDKTFILICKGCGGGFEEYSSHADRRVFCSRRCKAKHGEFFVGGEGEDNFAWKGGKTYHARGYVYAVSKGHPFAKNFNYVFEHRLVMENWLRKNNPQSAFLIDIKGEKYLSPDIVIHHKNGAKADNRIKNLEAMTQSEHLSHHHNDAESIRNVISTLMVKLKRLEN